MKEDIDKDLLTQYLREMGKIPLLDIEEEKKLIRCVKKGDKKAREKIILANLRLVVSIAKEYRGESLNLLDLIQEGNLGLIIAVEKFNPQKNCKFSTYAVPWIKQSIRRAIDNKDRTIRFPTHIIDYYQKLSRFRRCYFRKKGRWPSRQKEDSYLRAELGLGEDAIKMVRNLDRTKESSTDQELTKHNNGNGKPLRVEELLEENILEYQVTTEILYEEVQKIIKNFLDSLNKPSEAKIFRERLGLYDDPKTLGELARENHFTREGARQVFLRLERSLLGLYPQLARPPLNRIYQILKKRKSKK